MFLEVIGVTGNAISVGNLSNILNVSDVVSQVMSTFGGWIKAIGIIALIAIGIQITSFFMNILKTQRLGELNERMERLEEKVDRLLSRKKGNFN